MESVPDIKTPILVVDDDVGLLLSIKAVLVSSGLPEPALVSDSRRVMDLVGKHRFHLVLLDLIMPNLNGMEILSRLKEKFPAIECVIVTAVEDVSSAVQTMKFGAFDYMVKPVNSEKLVIVMTRALERYDLRHGLALFQKTQTFSDIKNPAAFKAMVAEDKAMALVFHQAEAAASTHYNVLITGESGTGKEMLAQIIHSLSHRSNGPFVAV
ncbi:MAG: response regulator, partial [Deltaproteobacteria bacterium]|nr:response regulator [Deltaproteobacteria bacterium]